MGGFDKDICFPYILVAQSKGEKVAYDASDLYLIIFRSLQKVSVHTYASHLADGKVLVTGITVPCDTGAHGIIRHVRKFFYSLSQPPPD
jgi:hypothetical protein